MAITISGIHHVTAISGRPQENMAFYSELLGLRIVKVTVNFDDPTSYHIYYGDASARPGTLMTFFFWPGARLARRGTGEANRVTFAIPPASLGYWQSRLKAAGTTSAMVAADHGSSAALQFTDTEGLPLALTESADLPPDESHRLGTVPQEHAIGRIWGIDLHVKDFNASRRHLTDVLGATTVAQREGRVSLRLGTGGWAGAIGLTASVAGEQMGRLGAGAIHHVAWRVATAEDQDLWRQRLDMSGLHVTPPMERVYFRSIYYREPGGVLFELATDGPSFTVDESVEQLGTQLMLPPWLEDQREAIAASLPPLQFS
ncbi:MAG: ring-cleaving dioxygenase [Phycisphaerales bacterium]|nr:ring-cleaving dioxygenase [Phycisphaerales bacterium]